MYRLLVPFALVAAFMAGLAFGPHGDTLVVLGVIFMIAGVLILKRGGGHRKH